MIAKQRRHSAAGLGKQDLPPNWKRVCLSELCAEDRRLVEPGSETAAQLPYLSLEHIESNTGCILRSPAVVDNGEGKSTTFAFDERHVLYGKLRPYLNKVALPDFKGRCTTELIPLLPRSGVSRRYLAWILRRPATVAAAMREKTGSRMPRASMKHVLALRIAVPEAVELQERLAQVFEARMRAIVTARAALHAQLDLLDTLSMRMLEQFPDTIMKTRTD